jgi:uncharacterized protein YecE (DUF72 family)
MSGFFDSEVVRESLIELDELQEKIIMQVFQIPFFDKKQKKEHLEMMKQFLEKQKVFIFRLSLSDDPEAVEMKEKILESAKFLGMQETDSLSDFFNNLEETIRELEQSIED